MFFSFLKKSKTKCFCIYHESQNWEISEEFIEDLFNFFESNGISVQSLIADTNKYKSVTLKRGNSLNQKLSNIVAVNSNEEINLFISKGENNVLPVILIEFKEHLEISYSNFVNSFRNSFKANYGFSFGAYFEKSSSPSTTYITGQKIKRKGFSLIPIQTDIEYGKWWQQEKKLNLGYIREVYQENILTKIHLDRALFNESTLRELINFDRKMGSVSVLYENCNLWTVNQENLEYVRGKLKGQNIIIE